MSLKETLRVFAKRSPDPPRAGQLLPRLRGPEVTNVQSRVRGRGPG